MQKLSNIKIISRYSVSSEDSSGLTHIQEENANVEIEAGDLIPFLKWKVVILVIFLAPLNQISRNSKGIVAKY